MHYCEGIEKELLAKEPDWTRKEDTDEKIQGQPRMHALRDMHLRMP